MRTSEQIDKLMPALAQAVSAILPAGKTGKNTYDKYDYATELDWFHSVRPHLSANGLVLCFSVEAIENLPPRTTKAGGTEYAVQVRLVARLTHTTGQWLEVECYGQGQDRADKAIYKAITGGKKYCYATLFALPTSDDPERDERVGRAGEKKAKPPGTAEPPKQPTKPPAKAWGERTPTERATIMRAAIEKAKSDPPRLLELAEKMSASDYTPGDYDTLKSLVDNYYRLAKQAAAEPNL